MLSSGIVCHMKSLVLCGENGERDLQKFKCSICERAGKMEMSAGLM